MNQMSDKKFFIGNLETYYKIKFWMKKKKGFSVHKLKHILFNNKNVEFP